MYFQITFIITLQLLFKSLIIHFFISLSLQVQMYSSYLSISHSTKNRDTVLYLLSNTTISVIFDKDRSLLSMNAYFVFENILIHWFHFSNMTFFGTHNHQMELELSSFIECTDLSQNSLPNNVSVTADCLSKQPYRNITFPTTILQTLQTSIRQKFSLFLKSAGINGPAYGQRR